MNRYRPRIASDGEIEFRPVPDGAWVRYADLMDGVAVSYEDRVELVATAIHRDCELLAEARFALDPLNDPWQRDNHGTVRHYGMAHDLVRRIWPDAA